MFFLVINIIHISLFGDLVRNPGANPVPDPEVDPGGPEVDLDPSAKPRKGRGKSFRIQMMMVRIFLLSILLQEPAVV